MSSILDYPVIDLPYPDKSPWYDLSELMINSWESVGSAWTLMAKVEANEVSIHLRTRRGLDRTITASLPGDILPRAQLIIGAYADAGGAVAALVQPTGEIRVYAPIRGYEGLVDGTLGNYIIETTYVRKAA